MSDTDWLCPDCNETVPYCIKQEHKPFRNIICINKFTDLQGENIKLKKKVAELQDIIETNTVTHSCRLTKLTDAFEELQKKYGTLLQLHERLLSKRTIRSKAKGWLWWWQ